MSTVKENNKLKSFLYLDNYKMYSFSSQLFEGLTEYFVKSETKKNVEGETQKGPIGSGRLLADIIEKNSSYSEKKFLHDYSYKIFEESLVSQDRVLQISTANFLETKSKLNEFSFVKISGKIIFNDAKILEENTANFNKFGEAIGYISNFSEVEKLRNSTGGNFAGKSKDHPFLSHNQNVALTKILSESGLKMDEFYLKCLEYLYDYGYKKQFEIQMPFIDAHNNCAIFSAQLIRENFKESEYNIVKKYSRESERDFTLFGILTQTSTDANRKLYFNNFRERLIQIKDAKAPNLKEAILDIYEKLSDVENLFIGKLDYEYVVDPIALYLEI